MRTLPKEKRDGSPNTIAFFTISIDLCNPVLAQTEDWVKGLSVMFEDVYVFALHMGNTQNLPKNVHFIYMGGRNTVGKISGILRSFRRLTKLLKTTKGVALYHMITWPILLFGPILRLSGWKQGVWYSHHHADFPLRSTRTLIDRFFSPTSTTFPLKDKRKLITTGHSLNFSEISVSKEGEKSQLDSIYCIGRIAPVKKIELLLYEIAALNFPERKNVSVKLIGPIQNQEYMEFLKDEAAKLEINLLVLGPMLRSELLKFLEEVRFVFNGTPKSVDKAALEACASGAILVSDNSEVNVLTGMDSIWEKAKIGQNPSVLKQIKYLLTLRTESLVEIANHVIVTTRSKNDFLSTIKVIRSELS